MSDRNFACSQQIKLQLQQLHSFIESKLPLILIIGEKNSGKSNLLNNLTQKKSHHCKVFKAHKGDLQSAQHLIEALNLQIKLPTHNSGQKSEQALEQIINHCKLREKSFLLIIDDADQAKLSVLATLSHLSLLQEEKGAQLQIILAGKQRLANKMQSLQTRPFAQVDLATFKANHMKQFTQTKKPIVTVFQNKYRQLRIYLYLLNRYKRDKTHSYSKAFYNLPKVTIIASMMLLIISSATHNNFFPHNYTLGKNTKINYYTISLAHKNLRHQNPTEWQLGHFKNTQDANAYAQRLAKQIKKHHYQIKHLTG